uniref:S-acyltransferase n=1 Tax=Oryza punctata TaxID=4537 RepID=A0A0E0MMD1_ORYPU
MASTSAAEPGVRFSDRAARRSSLGLRSMVLLMHVVFVGAVFLLDSAIDRRIREEPWYIGAYGALVMIALMQYFCTAGSSPGYVIDAMKAGSAMHATYINTATLSKQSSPNNGSLNSPLSLPQQQKINPVTSTSSWLQRVADLYPPGSSSSHLVLGTAMTVTNVSFSLIITVFGSEHALGKRTTAGSETILSIWTVALYIDSLRLDVDKACYIALTNQTTYEVARRKRIFYMRGIPDKVHPFSKGICRNIYVFCFSRQKGYDLEEVPPLEELEARAAPYTCRDIICCRCC